MKLTHKSFMLNLEETVTVGELKTTLIAQVMGDKDNFDIEFMDHDETTYMGIPIDGYNNWKKFKQFHLDMGIDFGAILSAKFDEIFTKSAVKEFASKIKL